MNQKISTTLLCLLLSLFVRAQTQTVAGNIYDEASKAPLTGVVIQLLNSDAPLGAVTDENGRFRIDGVPIGRHSFKITFLSYEDRILSDIEVTAGKEVNLNINMAESVKNLKEVSVVYNRSRDKNQTLSDMALVSARSFNVDETNRYAGSLNDPSRMVANFAGVIAGNDTRNDIVVRGNSPTGMLWNVDGLNTPNPNHFGALNSTGGPVSMINNNNIDKSDFYTGAFPAEFGNALAGVFDLRLRDGNIDKPEYVAQVGFNGFEGGAEGPIGKNTSYLLNYRYSTLEVFNKLNINVGTGASVPIYQDVNYKLVSRINKKTKLTMFGIAGNSKVSFLGKDVDSSQPNLYTNNNPYQNMYTKYSTVITGCSIDHQINPKTSTKLVLGYCTTAEHYHEDSIGRSNAAIYPAQEADFNTYKTSATWSLQHKFSATDNLQSGASYDYTTFNLFNQKMYPGQINNTYVNQDGSMGLFQAFVQWKHRFSYNLSLVAGVHYQYLDLNGSQSIEPRASLKYKIDGRNALSFGYGIHNQEQSIYSYFVETPTTNGIAYTNKNLGFTQSNHFVLSYDLNLTENTRIKIETYYQYINHAPVTSYVSSYSALNYGVDFAPPNQDSLVNKGTGYNYGAEFTFEHFLTKGFYTLITGSLIDSRYKGSDGVERNTAFNTGYVCNVLAGKDFKIGKRGDILAANIKFSTIGGRYFTPLDLPLSIAANQAEYDNNIAFSQRLPAYFRTDIRVAYKKEYRKSTMEFALDLENVTNNQNVFEQTYDQIHSKIITNYQQGFFPVPLFRYTF